jgi:hypothetical protein
MPVGMAARTGRAKAADRKAISAYQTEKQDYLKAKQTFETARADWIAARKAIRKVRGKNLSKLSPEVLEKGKTAMLAGLDVAIKHLTFLKARIKGADTEDSNAIINELDSYINWLESQKPVVETATTAQQLREVGKTVRDKWIEIRRTVKGLIGQFLNARIKRVLTKLESVRDRVKVHVDKIRNENLVAMLADVNQKLNLAREKYEAAKDTFKDIKDERDANALFKKGKNFIREAAKYARETRTKLKEIIKELKQRRPKREIKKAGPTEGVKTTKPVISTE